MPSDLSAQDLARLRGAVARLSPSDRMVLLLSAGEALDNAALGRRLGISERRARGRLARALVRLDRLLQHCSD